MSLGLPAHLARRSNARALALASRAAAMVCLLAAAASIVLPDLLAQQALPWWALLVLVPMFLLLVVLQGRHTTGLTVAYLLIGGCATYVYTLGLFTQTSSYRATDLFVITLPVLALILVGGTGSGAFAGILWSSAGFAIGELAVFLAAVQIGREFRFDPTQLRAYLLLVAVLAFDGLTRNAKRGAQTLILRTMREEQAAEVRHAAVADAMSELHDTTLSQLVVIAGMQPGALSPQLRARLTADLQRWGADRVETRRAATARRPDAAEVWRRSAIADAIEEARDAGLSIDVTGDREVLHRLSAERLEALGLAVRQCLANVLRHSGVLDTEVVLSEAGDDVTAMVVDAGQGFDTAAVGEERLGLRNSVRGRIERAGGSVAIFSSAGEGTSVLIRLPATPEDAPSTAPEDGAAS